MLLYIQKFISLQYYVEYCTKMMIKRVVIDVDVGIDDYLALLLLFHAEQLGEIKIEAIVCTNGNTTLNNVCKNVVRILEILNRTDIPVYRGASTALVPQNLQFGKVHGADGFGDLQHDQEPNLSVIKDESAAVAVRDLLLKYPEEISLICIGPLTSLALMLRLDDRLVSKMKDLWIMGGNHTGVGNVTSTAEFNFYMDPEAAFIVLDSVTKPIYLLTLETCGLTNMELEWRDRILKEKIHPAFELLKRLELCMDNRTKRTKWWPYDAFAIAAFLNPTELIKRQSRHHASVELHGYQTRGQVVIDHRKQKPSNIVLIEEIDEARFKELLIRLNF